jgi:hypothetical protein
VYVTNGGCRESNRVSEGGESDDDYDEWWCDDRWRYKLEPNQCWHIIIIYNQSIIFIFLRHLFSANLLFNF